MPAVTIQPKPRGLALLLGWRRVLFTLAVATLLGLLNSLPSSTATTIVVGRAWLVGLSAMLAYGVFEQWPARPPGWLPRWALQLLGVFVAVPIAALLAYWLTTGELTFWTNQLRLTGFSMLTFTGVLFGPWIALGAMVRQREAFARSQALAFDLERSELERQALDARMRLLQAQVQPHFLFNTLANVQALVDAGSPQAPKVLASLVAYLRAAVPRLDEPATTLAQEVQLVRAYLELMHLRMPDRLQFSLEIDPAALDLRCPPLTLLTLVENAVRHGIDPSEEGGRIEITVQVRDGRCLLRVTDTGVGLRHTTGGAGTGLATLRERLQLNFGSDARLRLSEIAPHGICAEVELPVQRSLQ
jgi:signal transduction histidine kinase